MSDDDLQSYVIVEELAPRTIWERIKAFFGHPPIRWEAGFGRVTTATPHEPESSK